MTINGPGAGNLTISGGNTSRIFETNANTTITISGLTITNGNGQPSVPNTGFGNQGGDIFNAGTLLLKNDVVSFGTVKGTAATVLGLGGGIFNQGGTTGQPAGILTLDNTIVQNNTATTNVNVQLGFTSGAQGGGIYNQAGNTIANNAVLKLI